MDIAFPYHFDDAGRTAQPRNNDQHIKDMIEQLLFTNPHERVNRPDFGSGLLQLTHNPNSPEVSATLQYTTHAALQQWLGDLVELREVSVEADGAKLTVTVCYVVRATNTPGSGTFTHP